jgi:ligand-binding SRPBCC domain-containing protein
MHYQHSFRVHAPLERVNRFHHSSESLKAITPPFFFMSGIQALDQLSEGDEMAFTLWMGPLPVRWETRIENVNSAGFDDVQISGPFQSWSHAHRFKALENNTTEIIDQIEYRLKKHWFWGLIGSLMAFGLSILFGYRARRTKALLEG